MKKNTMKMLALVLAVVALMGCAVGGTLAWLGMKTNDVVNTFVAGDINITLTETPTDDGDSSANTNAYKIIPGKTIDKDPTVTVLKGSEACWVFVKVKEEGHDILIYSIDTTVWTKLENEDGVYYKDQEAIAADGEDAAYPVLTGNEVSIDSNATKVDMEAAKTSVPKLTFTAYAIQKEGFADAKAAWTEAKGLA